MAGFPSYFPGRALEARLPSLLAHSRGALERALAELGWKKLNWAFNSRTGWLLRVLPPGRCVRQVHAPCSCRLGSVGFGGCRWAVRGPPLGLVVGGKRGCSLAFVPAALRRVPAKSQGKRGTPRGLLPPPGGCPGPGAILWAGLALTERCGPPRLGNGLGPAPGPGSAPGAGGGGQEAAAGYRRLTARRHLAAARGQWGRATGWWRRRRRGAEAETSRPRPGPAQRVAPAGHGARGGDGGRAAEEVALVGLGGTHERAHQARLAGCYRHPLHGRRRRRRDRLLQETRDKELQRWVRGRPGPPSWQVRSARSLFTAGPAAPRPLPAAGPRRCHPARRRIGARGGCRGADNAAGTVPAEGFLGTRVGLRARRQRP